MDELKTRELTLNVKKTHVFTRCSKILHYDGCLYFSSVVEEQVQRDGNGGRTRSAYTSSSDWRAKNYR